MAIYARWGHNIPRPTVSINSMTHAIVHYKLFEVVLFKRWIIILSYPLFNGWHSLADRRKYLYKREQFNRQPEEEDQVGDC